MVLLKPSPYRVTVNFNYTDFAEGTGITILKGVHSMENTTNNYLLSGSTLHSNHIETKAVVAVDSTWRKHLDLDFDLPAFNMPRNTLGTMYVNVPFKCNGIAGSMMGYVKVRLRKWDGSSETEITVAQSETIDGSDNTRKFLLKMAVPLTHFKKGDILRLTVEGWGYATGTSNILIAHDPKERTTTLFPGTGDYKVTTSLTAHIPFKINI